MPHHTRLFAKRPVTAVSLGCMSLSHGYGEKSNSKHSDSFLNQALDLGYTMLDTAAVYGHGHNESMLCKFISQRRSEFFLASKCGFGQQPDSQPGINGRPNT
tara:strand:+ start:49 stop:354 length:306 start_codon:yes stop_codon:yes gene_type:complete